MATKELFPGISRAILGLGACIICAGVGLIVYGGAHANLYGMGVPTGPEQGGLVLLLPTPKGITINSGFVLEHGNRVGRYGGLLNQDEAGFRGKSYLDVVDLPAKQPSMTCESGEIGSGYPVFNAAFSADGGVALYDSLDWNHQPHSELAVATFHEGADATITSLDKAEGWGTVLAVSGDGKRGASHMNQSNAVTVWDLGAGRTLGKLDIGAPVAVLALDSTGKRVVVGTTKPMEKSVQVWDVASGKEIFDCVGHTGGIISAAVSADDSVLATADSDGTIWMWSMGTGKALARLECGEGRIDALAFSADSGRLAAATEEAISGHEAWDRDIRLRLWDVGSAGRLATFKRSGVPVQSIAFSEDGRQLVTYGSGRVQHWEIPSDLPQARGDKGALAATQPMDGEAARFDYDSGWTVAFSADGKRVDVGGTKGFRSWEIATGHVTNSFATPFYLHLLNPKQDLGVVESSEGEHGFFSIVQLSTGKTMGKADLEGFPYIDATALSSDGRLLAMAGGCMKERISPVFTPRMEIVDVASGSSVCMVTEHIDSVRCVAFSPDSKALYSASGWRKEGKLEDGEIHVMDAATGKEKSTFGGLKEVPKAMATSQDGTGVWVLGEWGSVQCFDEATGREIVSGGPLGQAFSLALSPDGKMVAVGLYDHQIVLMEASTGKVLRRLRRHQDLVMGVAFSADGKRLASVSTDKTVRVWDLGSTERPK